jgi:hypothetical protein
MRYDLASPEWQLMQKTANAIVTRALSNGIASLTPDERTFYLVWVAEGEVGNGGMHAVCYNSTGDHLPDLPNAFAALGAPRKAALFTRLIASFGDDPPSTDHEVRLKQHEALPESSVVEINSLDEAFYSSEDVKEQLYSLAHKIRSSQGDA